MIMMILFCQWMHWMEGCFYQLQSKNIRFTAIILYHNYCICLKIVTVFFSSISDPCSKFSSWYSIALVSDWWRPLYGVVTRKRQLAVLQNSENLFQQKSHSFPCLSCFLYLNLIPLFLKSHISSHFNLFDHAGVRQKNINNALCGGGWLEKINK